MLLPGQGAHGVSVGGCFFSLEMIMASLLLARERSTRQKVYFFLSRMCGCALQAGTTMVA
jgi:hypothetical protein